MKADLKTMPIGGLAGWLLGRLRIAPQRRKPCLKLLERIALAPRQSLVLIEAEGRRFLVATSPEGAPTLYPLDRPASITAPQSSNAAPVARAS